MAMNQDLESRLRGTKRGHILREFFTNSAHFPIANIFLELLHGDESLFTGPDLYVNVAAAVTQAFFLGSWQYAGRPRPFLGNLIGPSVYTAMELTIEGPKFFGALNHLAYVAFSLVIGVLQELRLNAGPRTKSAVAIVENIIRTCILLVMYWIFEARDDERYRAFTGFVSDKSHVFISLSLIFVGALLGLADLIAESYLAILRETAQKLRTYSEWLLGKSILSSAVADPAALSIQRRERTLVFMDIRGFTGWSETQPPETVVDMLNGYFELVESIWQSNHAIKVKFTGDEIMLVFASPADALRSAFAISEVGVSYLRPFGLSAGTGIHTGILVEGLIGSAEVKGYDVIGDTVNTAKRICDKAAGGEALVSESTRRLLEGQVVFSGPRQIEVKGKVEPLTVYAVQDIGVL